jgi:hypothetical protein
MLTGTVLLLLCSFINLWVAARQMSMSDITGRKPMSVRSGKD